MNYYINPMTFSAPFPIPTAIVDSHLKLAKAEHIKVILYIYRHMSEEITLDDIIIGTGVDKYDIEEALLYWEDAGLLVKKDSAAPVKKEPLPETVSRSQKPSRADVAKRGLEDAKIRHLLSEAQLKFGRGLKSNEAQTLVWLCDDMGLDVSLILIILQLAVDRNKCNLRFIESTATDWIKRGITTLALADEEIRRMAVSDKAWQIVQSAFGMERRMPSKKEQELAVLWINEWQLSPELLRAAYDTCVNAKSKFSVAYTAKILESWHNKGYKTPDDIEDDRPSNDEDNNFAAYDLDRFERMLNSKD